MPTRLGACRVGGTPSAAIPPALAVPHRDRVVVQVHLHYLALQEPDRRQHLVLRRRGHIASHRPLIEERPHLRPVEIATMPAAVETNETPNPGDMARFRPVPDSPRHGSPNVWAFLYERSRIGSKVVVRLVELLVRCCLLQTTIREPCWMWRERLRIGI
jgi:hypothetical protein